MLTIEKSGRGRDASAKITFTTPDGVSVVAIVSDGVMSFVASHPEYRVALKLTGDDHAEPTLACDLTRKPKMSSTRTYGPRPPAE